MKRSVILATMVVLLTASGAMAQDAAPEGEKPNTAEGIAYVAACLGAALVVVGAGLAIGKIGSSCLESIARQPEAGSAMFAPMVVAAAMVEGLGFFAILVCLLAMYK